MSEIKETVEVRQVHDNDKFIIKRIIVEEVDGEGLQKIYDEVSKALDNAEQQLKDWPGVAEKRMNDLMSQTNMLKERLTSFGSNVRVVKRTGDSEKVE